MVKKLRQKFKDLENKKSSYGEKHAQIDRLKVFFTKNVTQDCSWKSNIYNRSNILPIHCVKSVRIWSYSGPYFTAFGLRISPYSIRMLENAEQNNSEYRHVSRSYQRSLEAEEM